MRAFDGFPASERSPDLFNEISTDTFFNLLIGKIKSKQYL